MVRASRHNATRSDRAWLLDLSSICRDRCDPWLLREDLELILRFLEPSDGLPHRHVVVDDVHKRVSKRHTPISFDTGSCNQNWAPPPSALFAQSVPPCATTIDRAMNNPIPMPSRLVEKNRSKTCSDLSAGNPVPKSRTHARTAPSPSRSVRMMTRCWTLGTPFEASKAFTIRLRNTS